jgi:hypothetical protein
MTFRQCRIHRIATSHISDGLRVQDRIEAIPFAADCFHPLSVAAKLFAQTANMSVYRPSFHRILFRKNSQSSDWGRFDRHGDDEFDEQFKWTKRGYRYYLGVTQAHYSAGDSELVEGG